MDGEERTRLHKILTTNIVNFLTEDVARNIREEYAKRYQADLDLEHSFDEKNEKILKLQKSVKYFKGLLEENGIKV